MTLKMFSLILYISLGVVSMSNALSFKYPQTVEPCVLLDIDFNITMKMADRGKESSYTLSSNKANNITVMGSKSCSPVNNVLILQFTNGTQWTFVFRKNANGTVSLKRILQINPKNVFGAMADKYPQSISFNDSFQVISDVESSYSCNAEQKTEYGPADQRPGNATFTIISMETRVRAQGFNVTNGQFSPPASCYADNPTTHTTIPASPIIPFNTTNTPTTLTTPTTPPAIQVNEYIVKEDNTTCIVLMAAMEISINYKANTSSGEEMRTVSFPIPANAKSNGTCKGRSRSETLDVMFKDDWSLKFIFNTDDDEFALSKQEDRSYKLNELYLSYVLDKTNFPNASEPGKPMHVSANRLFLTKPEGSGYYQCNSSVAFVIDPQHKVETSFLEFKAFNDDNDVTFSGSASNCFSDDDSDQMVPIIVGAVMGGLLLLILIAFLIHRYRKRSEYDDLRG